MYVHIGKNIIINTNDIIGIFDINKLKKTDSYDNIVDNLCDNLVDISANNPKSLILIRKNDKDVGYISNIISSTISNRVNN
ncbi:MAG: DUF370 domain-containing protein [Clostridia bacterium]|nr:DUF370 domain-containing protein [Clostridia bacterium]